MPRLKRQLLHIIIFMENMLGVLSLFKSQGKDKKRARKLWQKKWPGDELPSVLGTKIPLNYYDHGDQANCSLVCC